MSRNIELCPRYCKYYVVQTLLYKPLSSVLPPVSSDSNISWLLKFLPCKFVSVLSMQKSGLRLRFLWIYTQNYAISFSDFYLGLPPHYSTCIGFLPRYLCTYGQILAPEPLWSSTGAYHLNKAMTKNKVGNWCLLSTTIILILYNLWKIYVVLVIVFVSVVVRFVLSLQRF